MWILLGVLAVIVIIVAVAVYQGGREQGPARPGTPGVGQVTPGEGEGEGTGEVDGEPVQVPDEPQNVVVVPGANPITPDNRVLTTSGEETRNDVSGASGLAPQQTMNVSREELPDSVIKLNVSTDGGFVPAEFTVSAGQPVTISITNLDSNRSHTLAFTDPSMSAVILGAGPSETRAITFKAPAAGTYDFIDGIPGHNESGRMIVR